MKMDERKGSRMAGGGPEDAAGRPASGKGAAKKFEGLAGLGGKNGCSGRRRREMASGRPGAGRGMPRIVFQACLGEEDAGRKAAHEERRPIRQDTLYQLPYPGKYFNGRSHIWRVQTYLICYVAGVKSRLPVAAAPKITVSR
jgi:hypothetical protein